MACAALNQNTQIESAFYKRYKMVVHGKKVQERVGQVAKLYAIVIAKDK